MPINPDTGLIEQQVDPFPGGVFGGMISSRNAQQADRLANEAEQRRMLEDHLKDLSGQQAQQQLQARGDDQVFLAKQRQHQEDEWAQSSAFEKALSDHPEWDTNEIARQSAIYGQKGVIAPYTALAGKEATAGSKENAAGAKSVSELPAKLLAWKQAGLPDAVFADQNQPLYPQVPQAYWDKLRSGGGSSTPHTQAVINQKNAQANEENAMAGKAERSPANAKDPQDAILQDNSKILERKSKINSMVNDPLFMGDKGQFKQETENLDLRLKRNNEKLALLTKVSSTYVPAPTAPSPSTTTVKPAPVKNPGDDIGAALPGEEEGKRYSVTSSKGNTVIVKIVGGRRIVLQ